MFFFPYLQSVFYPLKKQDEKTGEKKIDTEQNEKRLQKGITAFEERIALLKFAEDTKQHETPSSKKHWDFSGQDVSGLSFVECDLQVADFQSAKIQDSYFDACTFSDENKRRALYQHDTFLQQYKAEKGEKKTKNLKKLQHVYQRFKRYYSENQHYDTAGDFHYQEMRIAQKLTKRGRPDRIFLWLYRVISSYSTNYAKALAWLLGVSFLVFPAFVALISIFGNCFPCDFNVSLFPKTWGYFFTAIFPKNIVAVFSSAGDTTTTESMVALLGFQKESNVTGLLIVLVVLFYVSFLSLGSLFIRAISRNFKR